jgi:hypothetical protein
LGTAAGSDSELLQFDLRAFSRGGRKFFRVPEKMAGSRRIRLAVAFIIGSCRFKMFPRYFLESLRLVEKNDGT